MAYSDFSLKELQQKFGITNQVEPLFEKLMPLEPSDWLKETLEKAAFLPTRTEKAKSETLVFPILLEIRETTKHFITIYSGDNLNVDKENGLVGECDFIIAKDTGTFDINYPILQVLEAKKNDIDAGVPQCAAQMVGAKIFNEQNQTPLPCIYGCVTTGDEWLFLKLEKTLKIDRRKYYLNELGELLSVFYEIVKTYQKN